MAKAIKKQEAEEPKIEEPVAPVVKPVPPPVPPVDETKVKINFNGVIVTVDVGVDVAVISDQLGIIRAGRIMYLDGVAEDINRYVTKTTKTVTLK